VDRTDLKTVAGGDTIVARMPEKIQNIRKWVQIL